MKKNIMRYLFSFIIFFYFFTPIFTHAKTVSICPVLNTNDDVKVPGKPAIYKINDQRQLLYYPSGLVYKSWKEKYSYKSITEECLRSFSLPTKSPLAVTYRPNSGVFKTESESILYTIQSPNILVATSPEKAAADFGNYQVRIIENREKNNYIFSSGTPGEVVITTQKRDAGIWPFDSRSPWNMPLAKTAQFSSESDACTKDITDAKLYMALNSTEWSIPVYEAKASDPKVSIYYDPNYKYKSGLITSIHVPQDARPDIQGDGHLAIIDPTKKYVYEMWKARREGTDKVYTYGYVQTDLYGLGVEEGGVRAYGGSAIGGLIRKGELKNGIPHALAFAIPQTHQKCCSAVWPATTIDSVQNYKGNVPMGQLIALPESVNIDSLGLSSQGLKMAEALQKYGAYDVDSAGGFAFYIDPAAALEEGISAKGNDLSADLKKIQPYLRCITNNTKQNVGGGAEVSERYAPLAPKL